MAIIKCKMCGGDMVLSPDQRCGTCEYCGSTMTLPKVDDEQRAAAFNRGNHFRRIGEFDKALMVYERILQEDDADAEAHWCCALCRFGIEYVKDPASGQYVPTCHRASFDNFLEDVDYLAALQHADPVARRQYEQDGAQIAEVQRGVLKISQQEEPFDVFLCYKESDDKGQRTVDSTLAQEIYYELTEQGYRVFFARITLEDKAGQEYEPYIFAALHSAKVMVVVGTRPEYLNAVWVRNEWSRYLSLMKDDRKRLLIPCYRDMDPYDLPEQLSVLQSYDMSRIGFLQDLTRGISKVLDADRKPEERETVVIQGEGGANLDALVKRGFMSLEDRDWDRANEFFDQALNMDAECAQAFLGQLLVQSRCSTLDAFVQAKLWETGQVEPETLTACGPDRKRIDGIVFYYHVPGFLEKETLEEMLAGFDRTYPSVLGASRQKLAQQQAFFAENKLFVRAARYADDQLAGALASAKERVLRVCQAQVEQAERQDREKAEEIASAYETFLDQTEQHISQLQGDALRARDEAYTQAVAEMDRQPEQCSTVEACRAAETAYQSLSQRFGRLGDFQDSRQRQEECKSGAVRMRHAALTLERQAKERQEKKRRTKQRNLFIGLASAVAAVLAVVLVTRNVVIPSMRYQRAETALANGNEGAAAILFSKLGDYRDASERSQELWPQVASRNSLAAGGSYTLGLKADGTVIATKEDYFRTSEVQEWTDVIDIAVGDEHFVALKTDGTVIATGNNNWYQCEVEDWTDIVDIVAADDRTIGLKADGTIETAGYMGYMLNDLYTDYRSQVNQAVWNNLIAVATGYQTVVGLKSDGTVVAVGDNEYGQCDVGTWTDIVAIAAGQVHTVGLKSDGTVVAAGSNNYYEECAVGDWLDIVAVAAGAFHTVGLKSDGTVVATGVNRDGQCDVEQWTDIVAIAAGENCTLGLKSDGTVVATGDNYFGQCDVEDWTQISTAYGYQG